MNHINKSCQLSFLLILIFLLISPSTVTAHVRWALDSVTPPRTNDTGLKANPCGGAARTTRSTIFSAGQTINVDFEETINHPGHYRIAFSPADDLNFDSYILLDNIPDITNIGDYTKQITIPMQVCSACTLQLIQVMTTSPTPQPGDYYYSCSDIQITSPGDTTSPLPVSNIASQPGDTQVNVNWSNPTSDFYRVVVLKDISPVTDTPVNGTLYTAGDMINGAEVAYVGNANTFTASALANDMTYYFKAFSQNPRKNYATGVETSATPTSANDNNDGGGGSGGSGSGSGGGGGGGGIHILFWSLLLVIRLIAARRLSFCR